MNDLISRQAVIDALWKALYAYEDKTEKQFIESDELDISLWFQHRIFVQNMSDIDRQIIQNMPTIEAEIVVRCKNCIHLHDHDCPIDWGKTDDDYCSFGERGDEVENE